MREHNNFKYTVLFGGGAIRGAAHVGVIRALEQLKIQVATLGGSSVGSLVAALYAVGYNSDEIAQIFLGVNFELFRDISFGFNQKFALSKGEVFLEWIRELIERKFYGDKYVKGQSKKVTFNELQKNLIVITTDLKNCSYKEFSNFETPDFEVAMAVRISCCMPGLMRPITIDDSLLVDGDLLKGRPMWSLSKNIANAPERVLEVRLEGSFSGDTHNPLEYVNGMYTCMTLTESAFIKNIYGKSDRHDCLVIDTGNVVVVDFNYPQQKRHAIIEEGYKQTIKYFSNDLVVKKQQIIAIYSEILTKLRHIQSLFSRKKYILAKNTLSEIFVYLYRLNGIVDTELTDALSVFQKLVFTNVKAGLLGRASCSNIETVKTTLDSLIIDINNRNKHLEDYLRKFSD